MSNTTSTEPQPARPGRRRQLAVITGAVLTAGLLAAGGFIAGRMTEQTHSDEACSGPQGALEKMLQTTKDEPYVEQAVKTQRASDLANLVLQNPGCFPAEMRAQAQTSKDQIAANANSAALSDAAKRASQCADPNAFGIC
jgi:hypothetical protein